MIDIINISKRFDEHKTILIEILVEYYGEEYREKIINKINDTYFNFSSLPTEDYKYYLSHQEEFNFFQKSIIQLRYDTYIRIEEKANKIACNSLSRYIIKKLKLDNIDKNMMNEFLSLFSNQNFESSSIDSFSVKVINLLNDNNITHDVKDNIIKQQNRVRVYLSEFGFDTNELSFDIVDEIIEYREKIKNSYREYIAYNTRFGKKIAEDIRSKFNLVISTEILSIMCFISNPYAGTIISNYGKNINYYDWVQVPITYLINNKIKGLDVSIIHELIHKVETNCDYTGIAIDKTNNIINEIRTQKLAIKLTRWLHELGIFIYDDPNNYRIEKESDYEHLFSLANDFLDDYEDIFCDCAINNKIDELEEFFGDSWKIYSEKINSIYESLLIKSNYTSKNLDVDMDDEVMSLINDMKLAYNNKQKVIKRR